MTFFFTQEFYTRKLLAGHYDKRFLFGDNLMRVGHGGQAAIRDMPNALGVATKATPSMDPDAFFTRANFHNHVQDVLDDLAKVRTASMSHHIVAPFDDSGRVSLGLGLARLDQKSPPTYDLICSYLDALASENGGWKRL